MTWTDTARVVAVVANQQAFGNWPIGQFVSHSVRSAMLPIHNELAVALPRPFGPLPLPTWVEGDSLHELLEPVGKPHRPVSLLFHGLPPGALAFGDLGTLGDE